MDQFCKSILAPSGCSSRSQFLSRANSRIEAYLGQLTEEVLFSFDPSSSPFPLARVTYIHGKRATWHTIVARHEIGNKQMELLRQGLGTNLRPMSFKDVTWGNHFVSPATAAVY